MRKHSVVFFLAATAMLASTGWARAAAQDHHDHQHQPAPAGSSATAATPATGKSSAQPRRGAPHEGGMDRKAMCDMHRQMMSKTSPADRKAMADREMKGMTEEQKQQHMKMMDEQCK